MMMTGVGRNDPPEPPVGPVFLPDLTVRIPWVMTS